MEFIPKKNTKQVTLELFKKGFQVDDIAKERNLAKTTIEGHLAHFVGKGELDVSLFVKKEIIASVEDFFKKYPEASLRDAKDFLSEDISFADLKFVRNKMYYEQEEQIKSE